MCAKDVFMGIGNAGQRRLPARRDAPVGGLGPGQGLILGTVVSVEPRDLQPLLNAITVEPRYQRVATVTEFVRFTNPTAIYPNSILAR